MDCGSWISFGSTHVYIELLIFSPYYASDEKEDDRIEITSCRHPLYELALTGASGTEDHFGTQLSYGN